MHFLGIFETAYKVCCPFWWLQESQCDYKILGDIQPQIIISAHDIKQWGTVCGSGRWHFLECENKIGNKMKSPWKSSTANVHTLTPTAVLGNGLYCLIVNSGRSEGDGGTAELLQRDYRVTPLTKLWHLAPCMKSKVERAAISVSSAFRQYSL